jgi:hypothetical protein
LECSSWRLTEGLYGQGEETTEARTDVEDDAALAFLYQYQVSTGLVISEGFSSMQHPCMMKNCPERVFRQIEKWYSLFSGMT